MNKRKIIACAMVALCLSLVGYGTHAYYTHDDIARNVITTGNIKIDLQEFMLNQDGELVPFEDQTNVMPGMEVSKIVQIENTGDNEAYIRVSVDKAITLANGDSENVDLSLVTYDVNTTDWTEKDGYYYYNKALNPGETTSALFTKVIFAKNMGNEYQNSEAVVTVRAYATQVVNNGETVLDALGWPEE